MKRCGEVWLGMAKDTNVESDRLMKSIGSQGETKTVKLLEPVMNNDSKVEYTNDLSRAKFDVIVEVGATSSTKKAATLRSLLNMARVTQDPETLNVLSSMAIMNMEGEGISEVKSFFRKKLLRMGVVKPNEQEAVELAEEAQNIKPTAEEEYLKAAAQKDMSAAVKNQADTIYTQARADKTLAETAETIVDIKGKQQDVSIKSIDVIKDTIESLGSRVEPFDVEGSEVENIE